MVNLIRKEYDKITTLFEKDVFLYTMGKAGSNTISYSLESLGLSVSSKHYFSGDQQNFFTNKNSNFLGKIRKQFTRNYFARLNDKIKVITLVRDPLARNLSMAFFALETLLYHTLGPHDGRNLKGNHTSLNEIINIGFEEQINHEAPLTWFEEEFNYVLNLDVYQYPFDQEKGYSTIKKGNLEVLILKLEKLNSSESVIENFLNLKSFRILSANMSKNYWYADLYKDFKKVYKPSQKYLDKMYQSRYCKHFYSPLEITDMYASWQENNLK